MIVWMTPGGYAELFRNSLGSDMAAQLDKRAKNKSPVFQQNGTNCVAAVDYCEGTPGWVAVKSPGSKGLFIRDYEWDAFIRLILEAHAYICAEREKK